MITCPSELSVSGKKRLGKPKRPHSNGWLEDGKLFIRLKMGSSGRVERPSDRLVVFRDARRPEDDRRTTPGIDPLRCASRAESP